jgi:hypothetical protein
MVTQNGVFGFVCGDSAEHRDEICLFEGAETMYVIRADRNDLTGTRYTLVGEAWMYLHMNGEVERRTGGSRKDIVLI